MNYYCTKCGKKNTYHLQPPSFCSYCGVSVKASSSNLISSNEVKAPVSSPETKPFSEIDFKFNITHLEKDGAEKLKDIFDKQSLAGAGPRKPLENLNKLNSVNKSKEDVLKEFQMESSTSRKIS
jgi:hypothetical protein